MAKKGKPTVTKGAKTNLLQGFKKGAALPAAKEGGYYDKPRKGGK